MKNSHVITTWVRLIHRRTIACHPFQFMHKLTQVFHRLTRRCNSAQAGLSCNSNQCLHRLFHLKPQHFRCCHPSTLRRSNPLRKPRRVEQWIPQIEANFLQIYAKFPNFYVQVCRILTAALLMYKTRPASSMSEDSTTCCMCFTAASAVSTTLSTIKLPSVSALEK